MEHNEELVKTLARARYLFDVDRDAWEEEEGHTQEWYLLRARGWLNRIEEAGYTIRKRAQPRKTKEKRK